MSIRRMTIQELIKKLNYLEDNAKQIQASKGDQYWLQQLSKFEDLFTWHPDADYTRMSTSYPYKWEMMKSFDNK